MRSSDRPATAARLLVVLGSGETAPSMTATHQAVLARLPAPPDARLLDTPYGFQENADEITDRIGRYFRDQVGVAVVPVSLRGADHTAVEVEHAVRATRRADWVFAGPGSPSYAVRHLLDTPLPAALRAILRTGGAVCVRQRCSLHARPRDATGVRDLQGRPGAVLAARSGSDDRGGPGRRGPAALRQRRGWYARHPLLLPR